MLRRLTTHATFLVPETANAEPLMFSRRRSIRPSWVCRSIWMRFLGEETEGNKNSTDIKLDLRAINSKRYITEKLVVLSINHWSVCVGAGVLISYC